MTAPRISMPEGKPEFGTVFFVYRARVQKKWTKRFGKKRVPGAVLFNERVIGGTQPVLYVHPDLMEKLKEVSK